MATIVDVVIPTYNNLSALRTTLGSLEGQTERRVRVVVCVDGSTDGTVEALRQSPYPFPLTVVEHSDHEHRGRAATRNLALTHLESEFVVLLDSDMRLRRDGIQAHVALLETRRCVSVGAIVYTNARQNLWARYLMTRGRNRFASGAVLPFQQFVTANSALRANDLIASRGFDERITGYGGEDTEFAFRLSKVAEGPFIYNADALADTTEPKQLDAALAQLRAYGETNLPLIESLHPDMPSTFLTERVRSRQISDRMFVALLNPLTDAVVAGAMRVSPFVIQKRLMNYQVIRAVTTGHRAAMKRR